MSDRQRPVDKQASSSRERVTDSTLGSSPAASSVPAGLSTQTFAPIDPGFQIGRYRIERKLGDGGFGEVFLARDLDLDRLVALKLLKARAGVSPAQADKELLEARAAARLDHPAITPIYDVGRVASGGVADGCRYMVSKWIEGTDLAGLMNRKRPGQRESSQLVAEIADGLHYAHLQGFVHRDVKPANILIDKHRKPHLADFGLAVHEDDLVARAGEMSGTPCYMAPEQAAGQTQHLDGRADIWSLGVILYELLTGRRPFRGESVSQLFTEIRERPAKPPRQIDDTIPAELERIVLKCLAKDVGERYSTAKDLAEDLRGYLNESASASTPSAAALPTKQAQATFKLRGCLVTLTFSMAALILAAFLAAPYFNAGRNTAQFDDREKNTSQSQAPDVAFPDRDLKEAGAAPQGTADHGLENLPVNTDDSPGNDVPLAIPVNDNEFDPAAAPDVTDPPPPFPTRSLPGPIEPAPALVDPSEPSATLKGGETAGAETAGAETAGAEENRHRFMLGGRFLGLRGERRVKAKREALETLAKRQAAYPEKDFPQGNEALAVALEDAADALAAEKEFAPAAEHLKRSLEIRREIHGPDSPKLTRAINRLGEALLAVGKSREAEELLQSALEIETENSLPAERVITLRNLAQAAEKLGRLDTAQEYRQQAQDIEVEGPSDPEEIEPPAPE